MTWARLSLVSVTSISSSGQHAVAPVRPSFTPVLQARGPSMIKEEPIDPVIPPQEATTSSSAVARSPGPRRRRGRIEVVLPTKRQIYGNNPPMFENASSFIDKHVLTDVVKKEEDFVIPLSRVEIKKEEMLSEDVVARRMALIAPYDVDLDPAIRDVTTTRTFTSKQWGGNTQATFPTIRPDMLARHGLDDFMYLNLYFNPHAPQSPGAPGLFFASSVNPEASEWPTIERVLVRLKANRWLYVGQYQCTPAPPLTPDEWKSQPRKVKQTWTSKVSTQGWGIDVRAKIALRKRLGRNPTAKELRDAVHSDEKFHVTPAEVHRAFDEGHAIIQSWCMKCVGYDENFQREIAAGNAAQ